MSGRFTFPTWRGLAFTAEPRGGKVYLCLHLLPHANHLGTFPQGLVSRTRGGGNDTGVILELSATLVPHAQRVLRHWATPRINPSQHGNSWNNHCLGDSSVLWNGNYFKAHSVLPGLLWILDTRAVLFSLNCTQCFSVPCLFMSVMCKAPNVPAFESPANSCSASRKTCISLPHCCRVPKGQAVWGDCSSPLLSPLFQVYPHFSKKMDGWPCLHR